ncbi:MAG: hypothetical protein WD512_13035 [Candidatus Paceibacterota bacterium]
MNPEVLKWQEKVLDEIVNSQNAAKAAAWASIVQNMQQKQNIKTLMSAVNSQPFVPFSQRSPAQQPEPTTLQLAVNAAPFVPFQSSI